MSVALTLTEADGEGRVASVEVGADTTLELLQTLVDVEFQIPPAEQDIFFQGQPVRAPLSATMESLGIVGPAAIVVSRRAVAPPFPAAPPPSVPSSGLQQRSQELERLFRSAAIPSASHGSSAGLRPDGTAAVTGPQSLDARVSAEAASLVEVCRADAATLGVLAIQNPAVGKAVRAALQGEPEELRKVLLQQLETRMKVN
eukprot:GHVT01066077.1.p2 GENE.GHVT01066077.1~~GHVT01066077.1.p2  ORF type:complete len:201 (-),score=61.02 GHVT01066077.1:856-1458(-)